jgi:NADH dehydrogenase
MMRARSLAEWKEAMRMRARVNSSFTYADRAGNIFYLWNASIPALPHPSAGDSAAVPDLTRLDKDPHALTGPSAQHAVRQAKRLAGNLVASLRGGPVKPYRHAYAGSVASLGLHKGVAEIYGVKVRGLPAWFMHRTYHLSRVPTVNRKVRVVADWTLALFFRREVVSLGQLQQPRREFELAALPPDSTALPTGT